MADEADPPRKFYDLKPREFERANPPPVPDAKSPVAPTGSPASCFDPSKPIKIDEVIAHASTPGHVLRSGHSTRSGQAAAALSGTAPQNEVHSVLADNHARERAAGLHDVSIRPDRRNRRRRDWAFLMLATNVPLLFLGLYGLFTGNVVLGVSAIAGVGLCSAGITWIMWVVMDKY
jgi:hypothetical protein